MLRAVQQRRMKLGPYEVLEPIGAGGQGEVFRARDTKLNRDVALKVLPDIFADDPERLARFQREAEVLASLNHPNIGGIYGLEEAGDTRALVLELVEGPTLAERIARGAIPLEEALAIARQIVEALEAAHEAGVIHRDLKPGNVKVKEDGTVKVFDFGLAKAFGDEREGDPSESPTLTTAATRAGVIMGTAAYMSPEQAKGKSVDKRADIWAFGVVLFEMLTGKRVFAGEDISETLAHVLTKEPAWEALPANLPRALARLLRRCLERDPRERLRDVGGARIALSAPAEEAIAPAPARQASSVRSAVPFLVAGVVVGGLAVWGVTRSGPSAPGPTKRFAVTLPPEAELSTDTGGSGGGTFFALSGDGSELVYIGEGEAGRQLYRRSMDQLDVVPIRDTLSPSRPFFSPDGEWLGFFTSQGLEKVSRSGGRAATICDDSICGGGSSRGGSFTLDGRIVVGRSSSGGLSIVSADGGVPEPLTTSEEQEGHRYPVVLPSGRAVLFTIYPGSYDGAQVALYDFESGEYRELFDGALPKFAAGHILFAREDSLWAVPFDEDALEPRGDPFLVQEDVARPNTTVQFQVAQDGTLVYLTGGTRSLAPTLVFVGREGREEPLPGISEGSYRSVRVSPDGTRLALEEFESPSDLWTYDVLRGTLSRLTTDPADDINPLWTLDGERVVFGSDREGPWGLFWVNADGTGDVERLMTDDEVEAFLEPHSWSPDGTILLFSGLYPGGGSRGRSPDIGLLSMTEDRASEFLIQTEFVEVHPAVSPDGGWMDYTSLRSGGPEVYVERFLDLGERRLISTDGGRLPLWSPDGRELF